MNFLTRFLKVFILLMSVSALGALAFYEFVIAGSRLAPGVTPEQFRATVYTVIGWWFGLIIGVSLFLATLGTKATIHVPVYDRNNFLQRVDQAVTGLRYRPLSRTVNLLVYKPPRGRFLMEKITVQLEQASAAIIAPRNLLKRIQQRL